MMVATQPFEHTIVESDETQVVVEYGEDGHARLDVRANGYRRGSAEAGRLTCEAIHEARMRNAGRIMGALDASRPTCGAILEALHHQVGNDVESIATHRAGASVMFTLQMRPAPTTTG
ncbi:hypothetical protein [Actinotalea sp. K2]|uniref:hypothetical protein n=1 Tax=Actinotalea sp. K2 TaxID=2939438 RepID=UPI002016C836|nr:hypothetical protein [Actinotalea sp. K2]MCL3862522.1 hypothetical protein [Actinotalea sp. K2]